MKGYSVLVSGFFGWYRYGASNFKTKSAAKKAAAGLRKKGNKAKVVKASTHQKGFL
jgi:hypothetical protein